LACSDSGAADAGGCLLAPCLSLQQRGRIDTLETEGLGHGGMGDPASVDIEAGGEVGIVGERLLPALVGQGGDERQGGVGERLGGGARHRTRHVGHAVVNDTIDDIGGIGMGGGLAGLEAAALIDGHVHHHAAGLQLGEHGPGDQLGRRGARHQHRPDDQVALAHHMIQGIGGGEDGPHAPLVTVVQHLQARDRLVQHRDLGAQAERHARGILAHHAAADHRHLGGGHAGYTGQQHAGAAAGLLQAVSTGLHRHAPGHGAHRGEQRQAALTIGDGLVGDAGGTAFHQAVGQGLLGGQVQVGEERLPLLQPCDLFGLGLLDLENQLGVGPDPVDIGVQRRPGRLEVGIGEAGPLAGATLHGHRMAVGDQLSSPGGGQGDAIFMVLDFLRHGDLHGTPWA
jgi:hypothetical protein